MGSHRKQGLSKSAKTAWGKMRQKVVLLQRCKKCSAVDYHSAGCCVRTWAALNSCTHIHPSIPLTSSPSARNHTPTASRAFLQPAEGKHSPGSFR